MKNYLLMLLILTACSTRYMTQRSFEQIPVGTSIQLVEEQYGQAYDTTDCEAGIKQYRYIERIATAPGITEHVHYIFLVSPNGRVVQKCTELIGSPSDLRYR